MSVAQAGVPTDVVASVSDAGHGGDPAAGTAGVRRRRADGGDRGTALRAAGPRAQRGSDNPRSCECSVAAIHQGFPSIGVADSSMLRTTPRTARNYQGPAQGEAARRCPMAKQEQDSLYVIAAAYDDVDAAVADYEAVRELCGGLRTSHDFDAAVIAKDEDGKVRIVKRHEQPTRRGAAVGVGWGLATGNRRNNILARRHRHRRRRGCRSSDRRGGWARQRWKVTGRPEGPRTGARRGPGRPGSAATSRTWQTTRA